MRPNGVRIKDEAGTRFNHNRKKKTKLEQEKASDLTAASMNHEGQSKMRARQNGDNKHHTTRCKNKYFIAPQTRLQ
jgi:hypothetical protein